MSDNQEFNIYYQYNTKDELENKILDSTFFLIEHKRKKGETLDYQNIKKILEKDGVEFNKIKNEYVEIKNIVNRKKIGFRINNNNIVLKSLECFNEYKYKDKIYIHFEIDENMNEKKYKEKKEEYKNKFFLLEEEYKKISENLSKIKNSNFISDYNISEILEGKKDEELSSSVNIDDNDKNKNENTINVLYLFCSIFDLDNISDEENECFEEIVSIYKIFEKTKNISANLKFEPLINLYNKFDNYFEGNNIPDILHININSNYLDKKLNFNNLGETINEKCIDMLQSIENHKNINKIKLIITNIEIFKDKKDINKIYIESKNKGEEKNKSEIITYDKIFIEELYENILKGMPIRKSYSKAYDIDKTSHHNIKINLFLKDDIIIFPPQKNNFNKDCYNYIRINNNCIINCEFLKFNYNKIIGRNNHIKKCIQIIKEKTKIVLVYGAPGAGKKGFVKLIGKYFYERENFKDILYVEIYDINDIEEILSKKIEQIKQKYFSKEDINNIISDLKKKILLIINLNFFVYEKNDFRFIQDLMKNKIKNSNIIFLYTCTIEGENLEKNAININSIKLDKLNGKKIAKSALKYINTEILKKENKEVKLKIKNIVGYPNFFILKTLFFLEFGTEKSSNYSDNEEGCLLKEYLEKIEKENKIDKILSIFYILKCGLRKDVLQIFFEQDEIKILKNKLKYIICCEADSKGEYYFMDTYFYSNIKNYLSKYINNKDKLYIYLKKILFNYALIFRYLVNYSKFHYEIYKEFHAGINQGFWLTKYNSSFDKKYNDMKSQNKENILKIVFDEERYFYSIKYIFGNYSSIIIKNKKEYMSYISQIIICFPTILYFTNNFSFLRQTIVIFENFLDKYDEYIDSLRFQLFKNWYLKEFSDFPEEKIEQYKNDIELYNSMKFEINLINLYKIYEIQEKKSEFESNINIGYLPFDEHQKYAKNNKINLIRLNLLYGKINKYQDIKYFIEAKKLSYDINDNILIILSLIELSNYYLNKENLNDNDFDELNKCIIEFQNIKEKEKIDDIIFNEKLLKLKEEKENKYIKFMENVFYFYISEPFFEKDGKPLKTELNNSFFLKYNLISKMPKNANIKFEFFDNKFLETLENKLKNPIKFIYIGSDHYDEEGNLYYSDNDLKSECISKKDIQNKIKMFKNKSEIIILGFINSCYIANYFIGNGFENVIYLNKSDDLIKFFKDYPYFYFYFQKCFFYFVIEFVTNLKELKINENFAKAEKIFNSELNELVSIYQKDKQISEHIRKILSRKIINIKTNREESKENYLFQSEMNENINNEIKTEKKIKFSNNQEMKNTVLKSNKIKDLTSIINYGYYGNKKIIKEILFLLKKKNNKIINIYGSELIGKSILCLELCKYCFMNNLFKDGIIYINNQKKMDLIEELKDLKKNKKNENNELNEVNDALIVFDNISLSILKNFIDDYNSFIIFTSIKCITPNENGEKKIGKKNSNKNIKFLNEKQNLKNIDLNRTINYNFQEEFYNYLRINNNIDNNNFEVIQIMENVYINDIVQNIEDLK